MKTRLLVSVFVVLVVSAIGTLNQIKADNSGCQVTVTLTGNTAIITSLNCTSVTYNGVQIQTAAPTIQDTITPTPAPAAVAIPQLGDVTIYDRGNVNQDNVPTAPSGPYVLITTKGLAVRHTPEWCVAPHYDCNKIGVAPQGSYYPILCLAANNWYKVTYQSPYDTESVGYIHPIGEKTTYGNVVLNGASIPACPT